MVISRVATTNIEATEGALLLVAILCGLSALALGPVGGLIGGTLVIASLLVHEMGHWATAKVFGVNVKAVGLCLKGAYIRRTDSRDAVIELMIATSGPLANLLVFLLLRTDSAIMVWVAQLNLVVALSNLIPIAGSDGHRMFRSLSHIFSRTVKS